MRIIEVPFKLSEKLAVAFLVPKASSTSAGWQAWIGNGPATVEVVSCDLVLDQEIDDSLSIYVDGVPIRYDESEGAGNGLTEFDLVALATSAGVTLRTGSVVTLFGRDNFGVSWSTSAWTCTVVFADGTEQVYTGGTTVTEGSISSPEEHEMGEFTIDEVEVPADRYQLAAAGTRFAERGILLEEYPSDANTIDTQLGLLVEITSIDPELNEQDLFGALSDELLLFIGDEIMSIAGLSLVGLNTYRIHVARARFSSPKQTHAEDSRVWIIERRNLVMLSHPFLRAGNNIAFKVTLADSGLVEDISEVEAESFDVTGAGFLGDVANVRVNGELRGVTHQTGSTFRLDWSLPDFINPNGEGEYRYSTRVEISAGETLFAENVQTAFFELSAAQMSDLLGAETEFVVSLSIGAESEDHTLQSTPVERTIAVV
ncbi:MAG TPA: hypothetical protein VD837_07045 [Terriglobales bacterium]|nr:hypothetical protein [Terriglobales bacterium]